MITTLNNYHVKVSPTEYTSRKIVICFHKLLFQLVFERDEALPKLLQVTNSEYKHR